MVDFNKLKKNRGSNLKQMTQKIEEMNKGATYEKDERIYKPGFDKKEGKSDAVLRLIPAKEGDNFVRQFSHSFAGKDGFYWEMSRSTIGETDPVGISNKLYWDKGEAEGNKDLQNVARKRKRQTRYYMNVFVEKDEYNPDAVGKVMILECGPQIFKLIEGALNPEFDDDEQIDLFDLWEGAPLKIRAVGREIPDRNNPNKKVVVPNYEEHSRVGKVCEFADGDEDKMKEAFEKTHDLSEFIAVKPFDELAKRFEKVTGEAYNALEKSKEERSQEAAQKAEDKFNDEREEDDQQDSEEADDGGEEEKPSKKESKASDDDDDDDLMKEFKELLEDDD